MFDTYQEHLDSQPDESRWDGFDRGDSGRDLDFSEWMTFAEASERAKRYASLRIKHKIVRLSDGWFDVQVLDHSHEY